ncbi:hypothetical protein B9Z55_024015 [Caenorhabditis nigoni]|uniref:Uncharacterized protein n=1 Tax=Caenorhabditis nigoni TaxID=1611254 RepID=A0A2G5SSP6_9PELO|nr:hypothetical protein B9Z55_024015 [Caenorhabditis nigoni]
MYSLLFLVWQKKSITQQGSGNQGPSATGRFTASVAPRQLLTPSDAPTFTRRGRSTQRTLVTINQQASRRRWYSRYASSNLVPPYRRSASVSQPYTPEASQKHQKALVSVRLHTKVTFGCHRRRRSQDSAKRSSGVAGSLTTVASSGGRAQGRVVATNAGAISAVPSVRGRRKSPTTMSRKRSSQITGAPQTKKRRTAI